MLDVGKRPPRRASIWLAVLAAAALALGVAAPVASAVPAGFWGVVPQGAPTAEQLQRAKAGGVGSIRLPISWAAMQPLSGGPVDWSGTDAAIGAAATAGIEILPFVAGAPAWAVSSDRRWGSPVTLPVHTALQRGGWRSFLMQVVQRYGPSGTFWAENLGVPKRPIRTWQIWNEENFKYFVAKPNPAEYGKLVKLSYAAVKAVDPGAKIVLGGMFSRPKEATVKYHPPQAYFATDFLQRMYETTPGIKSRFQGVALHPYTTTYKRLAPYIEEFRDVLTANHDAGKQLWITELGWSSEAPNPQDSFAKGSAGQVKQLKGALALLRAHRTAWRLRGVYWFSLEDGSPNACNFCGGSGLFGPGFVAKPAWTAFVKFTGGRAG